MYNTDVNSATLVRELVNCTTAQTVSPYTPNVYIRKVAVHEHCSQLSETDSL